MSMTINSMANDMLQRDFLKIATGKKINSASDDAAGLAVSEALNAQINGLQQGSNNVEDMGNLVSTAEDGLGSISDSLQRVRELSVQASSGILSDSDKKMIGNEIGQLMEGIQDTVKGTEFNGQKLLDGSFTNKNTASSADGTGKNISIQSMSIESLGLEGFDPTASTFDISDIDNAISTVSEARSNLGAISNTFSHTINSNAIAELNLASARSGIVDTDMPKAVSNMNKSKAIGDYQLFMQKQQQDAQKSKLAIFS